MPSITLKSSSGWTFVCVAALVCMFALGCAHSPNQFKDDCPSWAMPQDTPTAKDVKARIDPAPQRVRDWQMQTVAMQSGAVEHWPLYFEDPFEDKGDGRTAETNPGDVYRLGWEDFIAFPYCFARYTLNWIALPVSAVVTPPWTLMASDGELSKQCLGYDHDAEPACRRACPRTAAPKPADEAPMDTAPADDAGHA